MTGSRKTTSSDSRTTSERHRVPHEGSRGPGEGPTVSTFCGEGCGRSAGECPACGMETRDGHQSDCELSALVAAGADSEFSRDVSTSFLRVISAMCKEYLSLNPPSVPIPPNERAAWRGWFTAQIEARRCPTCGTMHAVFDPRSLERMQPVLSAGTMSFIRMCTCDAPFGHHTEGYSAKLCPECHGSAHRQWPCVCNTPGGCCRKCNPERAPA